jgi:hypothetical protein
VFRFSFSTTEQPAATMSSDAVEAPLPPVADVIMPAKSEDKLEIEREEKEREEGDNKEGDEEDGEKEDGEKETEKKEEDEEEKKEPEAGEEKKKEGFKLKAPKFMRSRSKSRDGLKVREKEMNPCSFCIAGFGQCRCLLVNNEYRFSITATASAGC